MSHKREIPIDGGHDEPAVVATEDTVPEREALGADAVGEDEFDDSPPEFDPASLPDLPPPRAATATAEPASVVESAPAAAPPAPPVVESAPEAPVEAAAAEPQESAADSAAVTALEARVAELQAEVTETKNRMLRIAADSENFKRRAAREREETRKFANEGFLKGLLPVLDNLDRALSATQGEQNVESLRQGVTMVLNELQKALDGFGVKSFSSTGVKFDPEFHEAVLYAESEEVPAGHVVQEYQKGYFLNERLVRPALVVVSKGPVKVDESEPIADADPPA